LKKPEKYENINIISEEVEEWIDLPGSLKYDCYVEKDVQGKTLRLIGKTKKPLFRFLYFVPPEAVGLIENFFINADLNNIPHGYVVVDKSIGKKIKLSAYFDTILTVRSSRISIDEFRFLVEKAFRTIRDMTFMEQEEEEHKRMLMDTQNDLDELINIGRSLSLEKDTEKLLRTILYLSKKITSSDAGSIFLVEENEGGEKQIRFKYSDTFSKELAYEEFVMPYDETSIAGYVAVKGKVLNIPDVYALNDDLPYSFNRSYDKMHGYRTKSMLVVPMQNHLDEIIGVIQLINSKESRNRNKKYSGNEAFEVRLVKKEDFDTLVVPFKERYQSLLEAVAGQAGIALENNRLIQRIIQQFDEFVKASVSAIESRDPATSGHSTRVAQMCVQMAETINRQKEGVYGNVIFSENQLKELELAGLLHDFGKVYIDPSVFLKGKKLYPRDLQLLKLRLSLLFRTIELYYREKEMKSIQKKGTPNEEEKAALREEKERKLKDLNEVNRLVEMLNEPTLRDYDPDKLLENVDELGMGLEFRGVDGEIIPILNSEERENLAIKRGSLNSEERGIIESHVAHSYNFVSKIPWPPEFTGIPDIVAKHHEKLDGTGYPEGLSGEGVISIQARMMTLADIFDALTAGDRPYKRPVPMDRVLAILKEEADTGKLDGNLVDLFIKNNLYQKRFSVMKERMDTKPG
jgi:HD-GYP domain-containing protein (c-di-GMP phosphodiesterase class II)